MLREPDRPGGAEGRLSPEARRRVVRAAFLRGWALLVLVIGTVSFAATLVWWVVPLTLVSYAALVFLAARDPFFRSRVLEERERQPVTQPGSLGEQDVSPERRARWLPNE